MKNASLAIRRAMAVLAGLIGLFLIAGAPWIIQASLERVLVALIDKAQSSPQYASGIPLFSLFFPLWRAIGFVAGITLLAMVVPILRGKTWTFPVALAALSVPSIGGMFMFLPYISFVPDFPLPMTISWVGLIGFWGFLLLRPGDRKQKAVDLLTFTFIGMLATHCFTLGIGSQRMLMTRMAAPLFDGLEWWILTIVGEVDWIATLLLIVSIPLLAMRKESGWWLALIAAASALVIDLPTQIVRTKTLDYLYGSLLASALLAFLLLPSFKARLVR